MPNIWVTSDTHFNHQNIFNFRDSEGFKVRPFDSVEEMNQTMIDNWNSVVRQGDKVYHLGDVFFGSKDAFKSLWPKLNGSKRLIVGNHDDIPFMSSGGFFQKVQMWRIFREWNISMSHVPMHNSTFYNYKEDRPSLNVHGHIHNNPSPPGPYHCVCVEQTNYTPVNIEELAVLANKL
jgi:calcineurin-like phosphoesterase family protein